MNYLTAVNTLLLLLLLLMQLRPKKVTIRGSQQKKDGISGIGVMTPTGVIVVPEKRDAVSNSDEDLWFREKDDRAN